MIHEDNFDFSFSGLKTAVHALVADKNPPVADAAAEIQEAIVDVLVSKTIKAAKKFDVDSIILGGGVVANNRLREKMKESWDENLYLPEIKYSTDNAAMIGAAAYFHQNFTDPLKLEADPSLSLQR
jgi:N6-L-threonylcarbamoyladenine synthase